MSSTTDNDLRDALRPLTEVKPSGDAVAQALMAAAGRPRPSVWELVIRRRSLRVPGRLPGRLVAGIGVATGLVCVVGLMGLPVGEGGNTQGGGAVLRTAAAAAAEQPEDLSGYRYAELVERQTYVVSRDSTRASVTLEQRHEQWLDRDGQGREVVQASGVVDRTGNPALQDMLPRGLDRPGEQAHRPESARLDLKALPSDPAALLQTLTEEYRNGTMSPDGSRPSPTRERYQITIEILMLLSDANLQPDQRAALFETLARMDGVSSLGTVADPLGRSGEGVVIDTRPADPLPAARFKVIFDLETSALLSWTVTNEISDSTPTLAERSHTIVHAGNVNDSSARP